jgi:hypothetical protein
LTHFDENLLFSLFVRLYTMANRLPRGGAMNENPDSRSRYLALALASRKALRSLSDYVRQGTIDAQFESMVGEVVESLKATRDANNLFGPTPKESPFTNYEQVVTLDEVESDLKNQNIDIVEKLSKPLSLHVDEKSRRLDAADAIRFFYALENRALHHYSSQIGSREP